MASLDPIIRAAGVVIRKPCSWLRWKPSSAKLNRVYLHFRGGGGDCSRCSYGMKCEHDVCVGFPRYLPTENAWAGARQYQCSSMFARAENINACLKCSFDDPFHYHNGFEKKDLPVHILGDQGYFSAAAKLLQNCVDRMGCSLNPANASTNRNDPTSQKDEDWWLEAERNMIQVFKQTSPSVVNISTSNEVSLKSVEAPSGSGSGFVWDTDGHIITNYHVIMNKDRACVTLADKTTWDASLVGFAKNKDLAVIRISAPPSKLKEILVGSSQGLRVGQHVLAIGNPFGLDRTLTSGIISGLGRDIIGVSGAMIRGVIQTDASINPGNSGGPLLDSRGRLIGVNTAIYSPSGASVGVSFAIPVDTVKYVVTDIVQHGKVVRAGLGILCANNSQARQFGVTGILVLDVNVNSAAAKSGIQATTTNEEGKVILGDIITAIDGQTIGNVEELLSTLEDRDVGEEVTLTIKRGSFNKNLIVVLEEIDD